MKKIGFIVAAILVLIPLPGSGQSQSYYDRSYVRISYVQGDVFVQRAKDMGYEKGEVNLVIVEGDKIGTKDGRAEFQLGRQNFLRLDRFTQVDVVSLPRQDQDPTNLHLLAGSLYLRVETSDGERNLQVHTPDASFYVLEAGLYRIDVRENKETDFSVYRGRAEVAGQDGSVMVGGGEHAVALDGRFESEPGSLSARRDEFDDWSENRDALYTPRSAPSYLPASYSEYENELADNGRWVEESAYGHVWVPSIYDDDWRPYYNGRWEWYPIIGWTWVPYESWGWCTMHYGRWGWGADLGWYWIPHSSWGWGPAWVDWYWDAGYVGWAPLSYYNYPGVLLGRTFHDRYTDRYYPNGSRAMTMIRRDQLEHRRISDAALRGDAVHKVGLISLRSTQPHYLPGANRDGEIASRAKSVVSRDNLRSVGRSFDAGGRRLTSSEIKAGAVGRSSDRAANDVRGSVTQSGRSIATPGRALRTFPSRTNVQNNASRAGEMSRVVAPSQIRKSAAPANNGSSPSRTSNLREFRSNTSASPSRNLTTPTIRSNVSPRSSNVPSPRSSSTIRSVNRSGSSFNSVPRSSNTTAPSYRAPSSSRSVSPRSYSSAPSRSFRSSSPSFSAPSRSYSAPSRSFSAPSRSSSAPSRSYSAPSRSYSSPSRSSSAPSRSSGSSSSRSSSGGGSIRKR